MYGTYCYFKFNASSLNLIVFSSDYSTQTAGCAPHHVEFKSANVNRRLISTNKNMHNAMIRLHFHPCSDLSQSFIREGLLYRSNCLVKSSLLWDQVIFARHWIVSMSMKVGIIIPSLEKQSLNSKLKTTVPLHLLCLYWTSQC